MLGIFGWALAFEYDDNKEIVSVYPARVPFRGNNENVNAKGYVDLSLYMKNNAQQLFEEARKAVPSAPIDLNKDKEGNENGE
jgi:hypothetical protein